MRSVPKSLRLSTFILVSLLGLLLSCRKSKDNDPPPVPSADKAITAFVFRQSDNPGQLVADIPGTILADTIHVVLPAGTNRSALVPNITITGKSINPASGTPADFTVPVQYTVKAEDNSVRAYTVVTKYQVTVFFSNESGYAYALDGSNGLQIWASNVTDFHSSTPVVANGMVYLSGRNGFFALDARNGDQRWKYSLPQAMNYELLPSAVVAGNTVYVSWTDGNVYAFNSSDGTLKWKRASLTGKGFYSNVALGGNILYTGCHDSLLYAINATTGVIHWTFPMGGIGYKNPVVANNLVFAGGLANHFYALNAITGAEVWHFPSHLMMSSPAFYNGRIYCGGGSEAWGFDHLTGVQSWHVQLPGPPSPYNERSSALVENDVLYAGSINTNVYAWDMTTLAIRWTAATSGTVYSSPVISEGLLYIGSNDGYFYALQSASGALAWRKNLHPGRSSAAVSDSKGVMHYPSISGHVN